MHSGRRGYRSLHSIGRQSAGEICQTKARQETMQMENIGKVVQEHTVIEVWARSVRCASVARESVRAKLLFSAGVV